MPQDTRPYTFDRTALAELAEDGVDAIAHTAEQGAPARMRSAPGAVVRSERLDSSRLLLSGRLG
jgi:hypothetical protein